MPSPACATLRPSTMYPAQQAAAPAIASRPARASAPPSSRLMPASRATPIAASAIPARSRRPPVTAATATGPANSSATAVPIGRWSIAR